MSAVFVGTCSLMWAMSAGADFARRNYGWATADVLIAAALFALSLAYARAVRS